MGMFDYVDVGEAPVTCPSCDKPITNEWQTKDTECWLNTVSWQVTTSFYTTCQSCNTWVEYVRDEVTEGAPRFEGFHLLPERKPGALPTPQEDGP